MANLSVKKLVDEFVFAAEKVKKVKEYSDTVAKDKKLLQELAVQADPTGATDVILKGTNGRAVIFKAAKDGRIVNDPLALLKHLSKKLTADELLETFQFSLSALDKVLSDSEKEKFFESVQGSRNLQGYSTGSK